MTILIEKGLVFIAIRLSSPYLKSGAQAIKKSPSVITFSLLSLS